MPKFNANKITQWVLIGGASAWLGELTNHNVWALCPISMYVIYGFMAYLEGRAYVTKEGTE